MKILISSESYWPNQDGGAVFEHDLVYRLINEGHEVRVLVPGKSWRHYDEQDGKSLIYRTASVRLPMNKSYKVTYYARPQVLRALNDFKPDVVHIQTMALTGLSLLHHAKKRGITVVATNHLMPENVLMSFPKFVMNSKWIRDIFWKTIVGFHNRFIAVSTPTESATKFLKEYGLKPPLTAISNGVDTDYYHPIDDTKTNHEILKRFNLPERYFIYLGRVNAEKRLDMLVKSFAISSEKSPDLHLVIAGIGNRADELKDLATSLGVGGKVHFTGLVTDEEKRALYQNAEFFAITSPAELQSIVLLEAAACGLPIISVDMVALRELCHNEKNGYLIKLDDDEACAKAINDLHEDSELRKKFGKYSRELVENHHSKANTVKMFTEFYETAIKLNNSKRV